MAMGSLSEASDMWGMNEGATLNLSRVEVRPQHSIGDILMCDSHFQASY